MVRAGTKGTGREERTFHCHQKYKLTMNHSPLLISKISITLLRTDPKSGQEVERLKTFYILSLNKSTDNNLSISD